MMYKLLTTISIGLFVLTGCVNSVEQINQTMKVDESPKYQVPKQITQPKRQAKGSLFTNGANSLFADRKSLQIGDIIFVTINEGTTGESRVTETGVRIKQEQIENEQKEEALTDDENVQVKE